MENEIIDLPVNLPDILEIISIFILPRVVSVKTIKTIGGRSSTGERLWGCKLLIEVETRVRLIYTSDTASRDVHSIANTYLKRFYISLPPRFEGTETELLTKYEKIKPELYLFDMIVNKVSPRRMRITSFFYLDARYKPTYEICLCGYYESKGSEISICYDDGQHYKKLIDNSSKKILPSWSPCGQEIAFLLEVEGSHLLYIININDNIPIRITDPNVFDCVTSYCWSTVGNKVFLSAVMGKSKDIYSIDVKNMNYERLTHGEELVNNYKPKCSNNGERIAYIRCFGKEKRLFIMDSSGHNVRQLTSHGYIKDFDWCIDNKHIVYTLKDQAEKYGLCIVNIETSKGQSIAIHHNLESLRKVRYSPAGKFVSYIGKSEMMENIYVYDCHKKTTINLTKSISQKTINDYTWKVDEKKIYISTIGLKGAIMYSLDIERENNIKEIMNSDFSYMTLSYRPRVI